MSKNGIKTVLLGIVSKIAYHEASKSANTSCPLFTYQSKLPQNVKELRKF
jgi:cyclic lactone autoinducer peptide